MKKSLIFVGMLAVGYANAQYDGKVGVNTTEPKATLDITAYKTDSKETLNDGLLIPRLSKERVAAMATPEASTLVYVNDVIYTTGNDTNADSRVSKVDTQGFYYFSTVENKWIRISDTSSSSNVAGKTLVYTDRDPNAASWGGGTPLFGTVPAEDPTFVSDPTLAENTDYIYVAPNGGAYFWDPVTNRYVGGAQLGSSSSLFYNSETVDDATGKSTNIYRSGKLAIGIKAPIASLSTSGSLAGRGGFYWDISVNPTTGGNSKTDEIFSTLDEAVAYANQLANNHFIRINLAAGEYVLSGSISRSMIINGGAGRIVNINSSVLIASGVVLGLGSSAPLTINQNTSIAFRTFGNALVFVGGHYGSVWNFTGNNQKMIYNHYGDWGFGGEIKLSLNRVTMNSGAYTGIGFWNDTDSTITGRLVLSHWQSTIPTNISYGGVTRINQTYNSSINSIQNIVGSSTIFNGLDTANNNALVERMRIHTNGNVGIGVTAPSEKLHINGSVMATSYKGSNGATLFPDYVFQKYYTGNSSIKADYTFKTLSQVEDFVKTNGHLPGYKSAEAIKAQGYVDLMETQLTNVEKIEELYLHSIEQEKAIKAKDAKIQELESRLEKLEKLLK